MLTALTSLLLVVNTSWWGTLAPTSSPNARRYVEAQGLMVADEESEEEQETLGPQRSGTKGPKMPHNRGIHLGTRRKTPTPTTAVKSSGGRARPAKERPSTSP